MERQMPVRVTNESLECAVCARTLLTGERAEQLVAPLGEEAIVCELCVAGARAAGWEPGATRPRASARSCAPMAVRRTP